MALSTRLPQVQRRHAAAAAAAAAPQHAFDIPAAPILIPDGPWREVDGSVCAAKGFKAQGETGEPAV